MRPIFYTTTLALLLAPACWAQTDAAVAAASKEAGAVVTKSGLVYRSLKDGTGASPAVGAGARVDGTFHAEISW